jgi:hypothetical protein
MHHQSNKQGGTMVDHPIDDFFTLKHTRLTRIAILANIFSWIVLVVYTLYAVTTFLQNWNSYYAQNLPQFNGADPFAIANLCLSFFTTLLTGIVIWLVLKGVALGLYMIVETDLNYRENKQGGNNEQQP